jgi:WXG100 family type VII secretion target
MARGARIGAEAPAPERLGSDRAEATVEEAMDHLNVDSDEAYNTSHAVSNDAEDLREQLGTLEQHWDNLSRGWSGAASSAFSSIWAEWHDGAVTLVDALAESSRNLGLAAVRYAEQDAESAANVSAATIDLGL